jgi:hypothetical protein
MRLSLYLLVPERVGNARGVFAGPTEASTVQSS